VRLSLSTFPGNPWAFPSASRVTLRLSPTPSLVTLRLSSSPSQGNSEAVPLPHPYKIYKMKTLIYTETKNKTKIFSTVSLDRKVNNVITDGYFLLDRSTNLMYYRIYIFHVDVHLPLQDDLLWRILSHVSL
jgi:hypothetical protein